MTHQPPDLNSCLWGCVVWLSHRCSHLAPGRSWPVGRWRSRGWHQGAGWGCSCRLSCSTAPGAHTPHLQRGQGDCLCGLVHCKQNGKLSKTTCNVFAHIANNRLFRGNITEKRILLLFITTVFINKQPAGWVFCCLTDTDVPLTEERVHFVDICHELAVTKGEISHISTRLSSCQHLQQSWRKKKPRQWACHKMGFREWKPVFGG